MKGTTIILNGDPWTVVDVAPAMPLAEMVAALLEEEGFVTIVRSAAGFADNLTHLGVVDSGTTLVLVPNPDAERAAALIKETVTDYVGDDLDAVLAELERSPDALGVSDDADDEDADEDDELHSADAIEDDDGADLRRLDDA